MARRRLPYGPSATLLAYPLLDGEIATDITDHRLRIGDGVTPGGIPTARKDEVDARVFRDATGLLSPGAWRLALELGNAAQRSVGTVNGTVADGGTVTALQGTVQTLALNTGTTKSVETVADLASIPAPALYDRAEVRADPLGDVEDGNGVWSWSGSAWEWISDLVPPTAVPASRTINVDGLLVGGASLSADLTLSVPKASSAEALTGADDAKAITPKSMSDALNTRVGAQGVAGWEPEYNLRHAFASEVDGPVLIGWDPIGRAWIERIEEFRFDWPALGGLTDKVRRLIWTATASGALDVPLLKADAVVRYDGRVYSTILAGSDLIAFIGDGEGAAFSYLQRKDILSDTAVLARSSVELVLHYGQSLSIGGQSQPALTTTPRHPHTNLMLEPAMTAVADWGGRGDFVPAFEADYASLGETPGSAMMAQLERMARAAGEAREVYVYRSGGESGKTIAELAKGGAYYSRLTDAAAGFAAVAARYGMTPNLRAVSWTQGEADRLAGTAQAACEAALIGLADDLNVDLGGQLPNGQIALHLLVDQLAADDGTTAGAPALAQAAVAASDARVHIVCPKYFMGLIDGLHLTAYWSRILGEYHAKARRRLFIDGLPVTTVRPASVTVDGLDIVVAFDGVVGQLVFDTARPATHQGFTLNDAGTAAISAVALTGPAEVTITLTEALGGTSPTLRYAYDGPGGDDNHAGAWGNLRDTDPTPSASDPDRQLHNWCIVFEEPLS